MDKQVIKRVSTIILFFLINFGLWELMVANNMPKEWASFSVYAILFVIISILWRKHLADEWNRFKSSISNWIKFFVWLILILLASSIMGVLLLYLFTGNLSTQNTENVSTMVDSIPAILSGVMMCFFAPIIEECTFRESIVGGVKSNNKTLIIVMSIIAIVAFDVIHLYQWQEFFYYLPISCGLTFFYLKHQRNVWASVIMHGCANLPGAIFMML